MLTNLANAFRIKQVRNRILFTVLMIILVRIGCQIPLPGIDKGVVDSIFAGLKENFGFFDAFTGSSFTNMSIFALNVTTYITASIIVQLLTVAIPRLEHMQKDGEEGQKKVKKITRYLTIVLAFIESTAMCIGFGKQGMFGQLVGLKYTATVITGILVLTAGALVIMWLGDCITEFGIGNGISIILMTNIISNMPGDYVRLTDQFVIHGSNAGMSVLAAVVIAALTIAIIAFIVVLNSGERRIRVEYSQKMAGRATYNGVQSHIPLKVNTANVMPIIFAVSLLQLPVLIGNVSGNGNAEWTKFFTSTYWCDPKQPVYSVGLLIYLVLIVFFAYFYTQVTFNPAQIADNLKKSGGFIPGIRPGKQTEAYLANVLKYLIFIGAVALCIIALVPIIVSGTLGVHLSFAGTSLIIVVSVILDTSKRLEAMLAGRNRNVFLSHRAK